MSSSVTALTPSSLTQALDAIAKAGSESDCAAAIVSAATLLQLAVLGGQSNKEFSEILDGCPKNRSPQLATAVDRAVSFARLEDKSTLGLWLQPVVISKNEAMPAIIHLESTSMSGLKTTAYLQAQLGLSKTGGWTYVLPMLLSQSQVNRMGVQSLINLPHQVHDVVRGYRDDVDFDSGESVPPTQAGAALYFLPFVTKHPNGLDINMPQPDERTTHRVSKWVTDSLQADGFAMQNITVHVAPQPQAYAEAFSYGERYVVDVRIREMLTVICAQMDVRPNALAALVAPYVTKQMNDSYVLGISLVSRLTGAFMATLSLSIEFDDKDSYLVGMTSRVLKEMGVQVIQLRHDPIQTISCQHCGNLQYSLPAVNLKQSESFAAHKVH